MLVNGWTCREMRRTTDGSWKDRAHCALAKNDHRWERESAYVKVAVPQSLLGFAAVPTAHGRLRTELDWLISETTPIDKRHRNDLLRSLACCSWSSFLVRIAQVLAFRAISALLVSNSSCSPNSNANLCEQSANGSDLAKPCRMRRCLGCINVC